LAIGSGSRGRAGLVARIAGLSATLCLLFVTPAARAQDDLSLEKAVKATYLYKFGGFVEWPAGAFPSPTSAFQLCVVGEDPFGPLLDRAVQGQQIKGRPITLRRLAVAERDSPCHIMFVSGSSEQSVPDGLAAVRSMPVLTITDAARDADAKGIIHFVLRDNRVRFEIDDMTAAESGLSISSKVLSLAVAVRPRSQ
jgi:hypothetical protein